MNLIKTLYLNGKPDMTCYKLMKHLKPAAQIPYYLIDNNHDVILLI